MTIHRWPIERNLPRIDRYATLQLRLYTVEPEYSGVWIDQIGIMLTEATNPASNDHRRRPEQRNAILLSLLHATQALDRKL
ncbi:hypothetical protein TNCV_1088671 [Trichonephila clavipes]|uniref:Uncharacterized protein n=1 Tax=Trichonephila clavipes TaxID=2585209 RepID=A0A8X6SZB2_TRICX|nr:hypothetical protein TNCV_1088671 [Trichonephila clavipes]